MEKLKLPQLGLHKPSKKTLHIPDSAKTVSRYLACAGTGFLLSNACIIGGIRPFLIAPAASLPTDCEIWAALGASLGALLFCDVLGALKYIAAVVLITLLRITAQRYFDKESHAVVQTLSAALSLLVCAVAVEAAKGLTWTGILLSLCESVLAGACAFLVKNTVAAIENGCNALSDGKSDILILTVCGLAVLSFMPFQPFGFPVGCVLAGLIVLIWSYCNGEQGGCMAGVCCGCIAGLSDDGAYTVVSCCMGGLLSGLCMPAGKFAAVAAYFVSCLLTMIANGVAGNPLLYTAAALLSGLLFLLLPKRLMHKIDSAVGGSDAAAVADGLRTLFDRRLQKAESAIDSFAKTAAEVNERIAAIKAPKEEEICHYVRSVCCSDCPRQSLCWDHSLAGLRPVFLQAKQQIVRDGILTGATLPDRLSAVCRKTDALARSFNDAYARFLQRSAQNKEILAVKKLASTQLRTASGVLEDLRQSNAVAETAPFAAKTVFEILKKADIDIAGIHAEYDLQKRIFIHITFNIRPSRSCLQVIQDLLSEKLRLPFAKAVRSDEKGLSFCFYELPAFSIACENAQHIGGKEQICGDSIACFKDTKGRFIAVLSDGMGTGERAALDSLMTTGLTQTLLQANLSPECTARLVNAALLLRSRQETVATLDIAVIDLYTGKVQIYKAGASFSVLQKKSSTAIIEQQSLPLGILDETDLACCEFDMSDGDCLYLMSDGASVLNAEFFKSLQQNRRENLSDSVEKILQEALRCSPPSRPDDITCIALRLVRTEKPSASNSPRTVAASAHTPVFAKQ